jgi:hypothetical protein
MVKLANKNYDTSQSINLLTGALQTATAIQMVAAPVNYQVRQQCRL